MKLFSLLVLCLFLVACEGGNVDRESPSFVDTNTATGIDSGLPEQPVGVVNETDETFVPPPANYTENATIDTDATSSLIGKDLVKVWVWNERGSEQLLMAEGTAASIAKLKVSVQVAIIGPEDGGEVMLLVNGQRSKVLNEKEEQKIGNTWVFISDIFVASPN